MASVASEEEGMSLEALVTVESEVERPMALQTPWHRWLQSGWEDFFWPFR
jgi:hypothetical protein